MPCALRCVLLFIFYWYHNHQSCLVSNLGVWSKLQHVYSFIFLLPCQQGCFKGYISKCVVNSSRPWGSDTCIYIQLPPGATFNDHNTWIFKDADECFGYYPKPCRKKVIYKVSLWHDANAKFTTFMLARARVGLTNTHWWGEVEVEYLRQVG